MNIRCENLARRYREQYGEPENILEVGALCIGSKWGRQLWPKSDYWGIDLVSGPNVDEVVEEDWHMPSKFDCVCSWGTLEHTAKPWVTFKAMADALIPGGRVVVTTPWIFPYHAYPRDCWRFSPDGYKNLCDEAGLELVESKFLKCNLLSERSIGGPLCNLWVRIRYHLRPVECSCIARKP